MVDETGLLDGELSSGGGDVAGLIDRRPPRLGRGPDRRESVPQILRIGNQPEHRPVRDAQDRAEFGGSELGHGRGVCLPRRTAPDVRHP